MNTGAADRGTRTDKQKGSAHILSSLSYGSTVLIWQAGFHETSHSGALLLLMPPHTQAQQPIWAKRSVPLNVEPNDLPCPVTPLLVNAPNRKVSVSVVCKQSVGDAEYFLRVKGSDGQDLDTPLDEGAHELLWSPDSRAFFVNGGASAYAGFFVAVYSFGTRHELRRTNVTGQAMRDMVISFPPCRAWNRDGDKVCKQIADHPEFNMSGIRWTAGSSAIDIFAEVPCSGSYGGIMCQVKGYEVSASDGHLLRSYSANAIPSEWRNAMAWKMRVPDRARYAAPNVTFPHSE